MVIPCSVVERLDYCRAGFCGGGGSGSGGSGCVYEEFFFASD